ncbi:MAG: DUF5689 domain-containing protein [Bacteroidota bacterium]
MKKLFSITQFPLFLVLALCSVLIVGCVDQDFDEPPSESGDPGIASNTTIADLKALHQLGEFITITEDIVIEGVVVADDRSGNFYRQLVMQDETGGITVRINLNSLYNDYPVGRRIFIDCKDLVIGDFNGLIQLGGSVFVNNSGFEQLGGIEEVLISDHIYKGANNQTITPKVVTLNGLTTVPADVHINTLIQLDAMEFTQPNETFATYNTSTGERRSENRQLRDCNNIVIDLRSSGFADFVNEMLPTGNGTVIAVYSVFGTTPQLYIRDITDLSLDGPRCDGSSGGGPGGGDEELMTIKEVRELFPSTTNIPANRKITGTVISDRVNSNINSQNLFLQDDSGSGIVVRFESDHNFNLNQSLTVIVSGLELDEFNGLLQVQDVPLANAAADGNNPVSGRTITIGEFLPQAEELEGTLVTFENVSLSKSSGTDFAREIILNDGTGTVALWTAPAASFANANFPTNEVTLTGIVSQFNNLQITMRNLEDIVGGNNGGGGGGGTVDGEIDESFNSTAPEQDVNLSGWTNVAIKGDRIWRGKEFSGNKYVQATAFNDNNPDMETWLITPAIELDDDKTLSFETAKAFWKHDGLTVWVSSDFDGNNVAEATWTELNVDIAGESRADYEWVPSGDIDLSVYSGTIYIGFKYVGNGTANTTTYLLDNVKVKKQ